MPVRSLRSPVLKWPARAEVLQAAQAWATSLQVPGLLRVGVFGSYARGDAGVGSDLDLVVLLRDSPLPFHQRTAGLPTERLPVPADVLVYTQAEWQHLPAHSPRLARVLGTETLWLREEG